jgi:hypothetical protein
MEQQNYTCSIAANITAKEAFDKISHVSEWWISNVEGTSQKLNDVFTVSLGTTWVRFEITEVVGDEKVVWQVTGCNLPWLNDKTEWKHTRIVWEVSATKSATQISFAHIGLVPDLECYNQCEKSWSSYIKESLFKFITQGKGLPDKF